MEPTAPDRRADPKPALMNTSAAAYICGLSHMAVYHWIEQCFLAGVPFETRRGTSYLVLRSEVEALRKFRQDSGSWTASLKAVASDKGLSFPSDVGAISLLKEGDE